MIRELLFFDFVDFEDIQESATKMGGLVDVVPMTDNIDSHHFFESFADRVITEDSIVSVDSTYHQSFSDTLVFSEHIEPRVNIETTDDLLYMLDQLIGVNPHIYTDSLAFVETLNAYSGPVAKDILTLSDEIQYDASLGRTTVDTLDLSSAISGYRNDWRIPVFPILEET